MSLNKIINKQQKNPSSIQHTALVATPVLRNMVLINKFLIFCVPTMLLHGAGSEGIICTGKTGVQQDLYLSLFYST